MCTQVIQHIGNERLLLPSNALVAGGAQYRFGLYLISKCPSVVSDYDWLPSQMIRSFDHTTEYRGYLFVQNLGDVPYSVRQDIKLYTTVTRATVFTLINIHTVELLVDKELRSC